MIDLDSFRGADTQAGGFGHTQSAVVSCVGVYVWERLDQVVSGRTCL